MKALGQEIYSILAKLIDSPKSELEFSNEFELLVAVMLSAQCTDKRVNLITKDLFGKYLSFGIIFQIGFQACLNLMVVTGLIPVTGVTLPFLSYGGSFTVSLIASLAVIQRIHIEMRNEKIKI